MDGSEFILYTSRSRCLISIFPMENETELKQSIFAMGVYCCNLFSDGASFHSGGKHFGSTKLTSVQRIWKCLDGYILRRSCSLLRISMDQTAHRKCESNLAVQAKKILKFFSTATGILLFLGPVMVIHTGARLITFTDCSETTNEGLQKLYVIILAWIFVSLTVVGQPCLPALFVVPLLRHRQEPLDPSELRSRSSFPLLATAHKTPTPMFI